MSSDMPHPSLEAGSPLRGEDEEGVGVTSPTETTTATETQVSVALDNEGGSDVISPETDNGVSAHSTESQSAAAPPPPTSSTATKARNPTMQEKVSIWGIVVFSAGTVFMLSSMGVLAFLWFADETNGLWKDIMLRNWVTRAVAICAEVVKQAMGFQMAAVVAMLASLALERAEPVLAHVASLSMMRATAGSGTLLVLLRNYLVGFWWARSFRSTAVFFLVTAATQAISILLLSDIGLDIISGRAVAAERAFSFSDALNTSDSRDFPLRRIERVGTWFTNIKAARYPVFAEYSEAPYTADGVSDTGLTLRAFLPFQDAQDRQTVKSYSGLATVMDARVTCQIPALVRPRVQILSQMSQLIILEGAVQASRHTPRLGNATLNTAVGFDVPIPFSCLAPPGPNKGDNTYETFDDKTGGWWLSICQLPNGQGKGTSLFAGGLISEFRDASQWTRDMANLTLRKEESRHGAAYLVVNVTTGNQARWKAVVEDDTRGRGYAPPAYSHRNEWLDLVFSDGSLVLSTTLCYTAFQFGELPVTMTSSANRSEPAPVFAPGLRRYLFDGVRAQLGQNKSLSLQDRGVLQLEQKQHEAWIVPDDGRYHSPSFMRDQADLSRTAALATTPGGNVSALMTRSTECPSPFGNGTLQQIDDLCVAPELEYLFLMQEILATGGSVAFALQSLLTTLSTAAYYDQMGQFDNVTTVEQAFFTVASQPVSTTGFWLVAATVAAHLVLSVAVLVIFLKGTTLSRVGATWTALAQVMTGDGETYLGLAHSSTDGRLEEAMKADSVRGRRAGLQRVHDRVEVFLPVK